MNRKTTDRWGQEPNCKNCNGAGYEEVLCPNCEGKGIDCEDCEGAGTLVVSCENPIHGVSTKTAYYDHNNDGYPIKERATKMASISWDEVEIINELVAEFGEENREEITDSLNLDSGRYSHEGNAGEVKVDGTTYSIIENEDEAERIATDYVREMLESEPETFSQDWLQSHIYITDTDKRMIALDEGEAFRESIEDDPSSYLDEGDYIDKDGNEDEDRKEELIEKKVDEHIDEVEEALGDPIAYFVDEQGIYSIEGLMQQNFISIDLDEAVDDAIGTDGWAHFLSIYDGNYDTTKNGLVYFKED